MTGPRTVALAAALLLAGSALARAQQPACTSAPEPPANVQTKLDAALKATAKDPFTPAVLTVSWQPPAADRKNPGNVPSLYLLEAGSDRGRADVAVVRIAATELTYTTPMTNGTFFVHVRAVNECGTGRPSSDQRVRVQDSVDKGQPSPFVLLSTLHATRERLGTQAYVRVVGQVRNGWEAAPASFTKVTASFESAKGELGVVRTSFVNGTSRRLTRSHIVTDTAIEPGGTGCFVMFVEFPSNAVTGLGVIAAAEQVESEPVTSEVLLDGPTTKQADPFDDLMVSGRLKNTGSRPTQFNQVWVEGRDAMGQLLDCHGALAKGSDVVVDDGLTTHTGLEPGQTAQFQNTTEMVFAMVALVRQWVSWDEKSDDSSALTPKYRDLRKQLATLLEGDPQATSSQEIAQARDALRAEALAIEQRLAPHR